MLFKNLNNFTLEERVLYLQDKTKEIGYKNGLYLNKGVVNQTEWTVDKIKSRTDELVKILMDMYKC